METQQITAYKTLAESVITLAISDLKVKKERARAHRFLTHPDMAPYRALWLAWLGLNEDAFQKLLHQREFQGNLNKLNLA